MIGYIIVKLVQPINSTALHRRV